MRLPIQGHRAALAFIAVLMLAALVYWPGLSGGFLFDDFVNLDALGRYGGVRDWSSFWLYLTTGSGDPTGRPLAMLSFLIDGQDWPADPQSFKRSNLLLHLLNGALAFFVLSRLGTRAGLEIGHANRAAALGTTLWLLHPLWVSTTLYVVQRQAMLPLTFLLIALLLWDNAWRRLENGRITAAWLWGFVGVGLATACAVLSKANGALTPALLALVWWLIYRPRATSLPQAMAGHSAQLARWSLLVPAALLVLALLSLLPGAISSTADVRPWGFAERLLSQPRALVDYLGLLWLPRQSSFGLAADHFMLSQSLLRPWTTAPALGLVLGLMAVAIHQRQRHPLVSLAVLFFFVGHAMESSFIPLEPYFEHRNYLPAVLLFWPLAAWLTKLERLPDLKRALWLALPLALALLTLLRAQVWGDPARLIAASAENSPDSHRAQLNLAVSEINSGLWHQGRARLADQVDLHPYIEVLALNLIDADCLQGRVPADTLQAASRALASTTRWRAVDFNWFTRQVQRLPSTGCEGLDTATLESLIASAQTNPRIQRKPGAMQDLLSLRGLIALKRNRPDEALRLFNQALAAEPNPDSALMQAAQLGSAGFVEAGLEHLAHYRECCWRQNRPANGMTRVHQWLKWRPGGYYETEFSHLEAALIADIRQKAE